MPSFHARRRSAIEFSSPDAQPPLGPSSVEPPPSQLGPPSLDPTSPPLPLPVPVLSPPLHPRGDDAAAKSKIVSSSPKNARQTLWANLHKPFQRLRLGSGSSTASQRARVASILEGGGGEGEAVRGDEAMVAATAKSRAVATPLFDDPELLSRNRDIQKEAVRRFLVANIRGDWSFTGRSARVHAALLDQDKDRRLLICRDTPLSLQQTHSHASTVSSTTKISHPPTASSSSPASATFSVKSKDDSVEPLDDVETPAGNGQQHLHREEAPVFEDDVDVDVDVDDETDDYSSDSVILNHHNVDVQSEIRYTHRLDWDSEVSDSDGGPLPSSQHQESAWMGGLSYHQAPAMMEAYERSCVARSKRDSRQRQVDEESQWNAGLAVFEARRNAWTGARHHTSEPGIHTAAARPCSAASNPSKPIHGGAFTLKDILNNHHGGRPALPHQPRDDHERLSLPLGEKLLHPARPGKLVRSVTSPDTPQIITSVDLLDHQPEETTPKRSPPMVSFVPSSLTTAGHARSISANDGAYLHHLQDTLSPYPGTTADATRSTIGGKRSHVGQAVVVPIAPPLLPPENLMRSSIKPSMYSSIFDKVIVKGLAPSCPINLRDMIGVCVEGWKQLNEWPPQPQQPILPAFGRRKKAPREGTPPQAKSPSLPFTLPHSAPKATAKNTAATMAATGAATNHAVTNATILADQTNRPHANTAANTGNLLYVSPTERKPRRKSFGFLEDGLHLKRGLQKVFGMSSNSTGNGSRNASSGTNTGGDGGSAVVVSVASTVASPTAPSIPAQP